MKVAAYLETLLLLLAGSTIGLCAEVIPAKRRSLKSRGKGGSRRVDFEKFAEKGVADVRKGGDDEGDCPRGYAGKRGSCTCTRKCPINSVPQEGVECPVNFRRNCVCMAGYRRRGKRCVRMNRFNPVLPLFGPSVTKPYQTCRELRRGISKGLQILADSIITKESESSKCRFGFSASFFSRDSNDIGVGDGGGEGGGSGEDSFETNNQVEGVDEADVVKSDGEFIFSAYGTDLVMMSLDGEVIDRVTTKSGNDRTGKTVRSLLLDTESQIVTAIAFDDFGGSERVETSAYIYSYKSGSLEKSRVINAPGRYLDARSIGSKAHIISSVFVETFTITDVLNRCSAQYLGMTDEEYEELAFNNVKKVIRRRVVELMRQLGFDTDSSSKNCRNIIQISSMTDVEDGSSRTDEDSLLDVWGGSGLLQNFISITSFDMADSARGKDSKVETAGVFVPTGDTEVFANSEFIVLAGRGYRRIRESVTTNVWSEYTYLVGFEFQKENSKVTPSAVGSVKGYLLNQFSMDFYDGILRVATTNDRKWGFVDDRWQFISESSSQVSKLEFIGGRMQLVGQVTGLGATERIFSVRFVRNRGYIVTFRQVDPLFVIDMDPDVPVVLGELKITGFSNFLQPIGKNDEYLLGIGQEADEDTGRATGLKISLFDVTDSSKPEEVQNHVVEGFSRSAAKFESKAFRYLPVSRKLILPVQVDSRGVRDDFDGFIIFDVDPKEGIVRSGEVTHADSKSINDRRGLFCFSSTRLEPRSLVFAGNLVTFKGHTVKYSKDLTSLEPVWTVNLDDGRNEAVDRCYPYFR